jgi:L-erythro-3,5-diaminohexanoate dehydrogenase
MPVLDPFGLRRVVRPVGAMPQSAEQLDPKLPLADDELEIAVDHLNIDAASFRQIERAEGGDKARIAGQITDIVASRGKMQNPVTGSGGMLIGRVHRVGSEHPARAKVKVGDRIATLVSLTLTPLEIEAIHEIHAHAERVDVTGRAILFASGLFAVLPTDFPEPLALAILDVCGAPAWVTRLAKPGQAVLVIGAGKSGSLACAAAKEQVGPSGKVIALDLRIEGPQRFVDRGLADLALAADATKPTAVYDAVRAATGERLCDLVVNCASVPSTEMASILSTKQHGSVLFFSMATSFTAAALGAEGVGKDVTMYVGNGYAENHADDALALVRRTPALRELFEARVRG